MAHLSSTQIVMVVILWFLQRIVAKFLCWVWQFLISHYKRHN